jgi:hypothetical protein
MRVFSSDKLHYEVTGGKTHQDPPTLILTFRVYRVHCLGSMGLLLIVMDQHNLTTPVRPHAHFAALTLLRRRSHRRPFRLVHLSQVGLHKNYASCWRFPLFPLLVWPSTYFRTLAFTALGRAAIPEAGLHAASPSAPLYKPVAL